MKRFVIAGIAVGIIIVFLVGAVGRIPGQGTLIDQLMNSSPSTTLYEINNLYDLCVNQVRVFGGPESRYYYEELRDYAASNPNDPLSPKGQLGMNFMTYEQKLSEQHIKDLIWNYKINPSLVDVVARQVRGDGSPFVENIANGGSRAIPCDEFLP